MPVEQVTETVKQREEKMRKVLRDIQAQRPIGEFSFEEQRILKECYEAGFFEGVVLCEMISGRIVAEYRHHPRLTYKGLQFLDASPEQDEGDEPDQADAAKVNSDIGKQSLQWTKAGVFVAAVVGLLTIAATVLVARFF